MSGVTIAEIQEQEEAIFNDNTHKYMSHMKYPSNYQQARAKALQQLALSEDSPFNLDGVDQQQLVTELCGENDNELKILMDEKARMLRDETEEIKRQLDLVRSQINELHEQPKESPRAKPVGNPICRHHLGEEHPKQSDENSCRPSREATGERRHEFVNNQQLTSTDSQFAQVSKTGASKQQDKPMQALGVISNTNPRLRPLTGKTDCPNCACDRRRSVCDRCMDFQKQTAVVQKDTKESIIKRQPTFITEQQISNIISTSGEEEEQRVTSSKVVNYRDYDERPIRPAQQKLEDVLSSGAQDNVDTSTSRQYTKANTSVNEVVVPGKLYTIGKSLNEKRTKLAQAIEDLQLMMEKLKKRGERLDQERKVAQLYKGQWRFGPTIGGSSSSLNASGRRGSSESLRGGIASSYQSRLDPNLARDSNSMMGFQHVGPSMKNLRQQAGTNASQLPPKPKPRLSKLNNMRLANASNLYRRPTRASLLHARSKSIESLHTQTTPTVKKKSPTATERLQASKGNYLAKPTTTRNNDANFQNGKSSSQTDLARPDEQRNSTSSLSSPDSSTAVEENLEQDEIREEEEEGKEEKEKESDKSDPESRSSSTDSTKRSVEIVRADRTHQDRGGNEFTSKSVQDQEQQPQVQPRKKTWVPVFGETEIKTIDVRPPPPPQPQEKVVVFNSPFTSRRPVSNGQFKSILRTNQSSAMNRGSLANDRVLNEASKKLQFASDLLEREHNDSKTTNQLIVNKTRPNAPPVRSNSSITQRQLRQRQIGGISPAARRHPPSARVTSGNERSPVGQTSAVGHQPAIAVQSVTPGANQEIARLEQMISEQQALLLKLTQQSPLATPPCCHHHSATPCTRVSACDQVQPAKYVHHQQQQQQQQTGRQLISNLRERLNKTKARLARTLEEERTKHQQLEQKVDSSLRKQSDLENENELLKKSLSKCIDTCLRDISSTFESLSDTLSESIYMDPQSSSNQPVVPMPTEAANVSPLLSNAAQLIADNRHLKRMKSHIDSIERQRRAIFEELNQEKHKSQQLELELEQSKFELEQLIEAKHRFEAAQTSETGNQVPASLEAQPVASTSKQVNFAPSPTIVSSDTDHQNPPPTRSATELQDQQQFGLTSESCSLTASSAQDDTTTSTTTTYNSIDTYRQYIKSMTPDLDAIRRERRMILDDFDNIKKMLSDMDNN